MLGLLLLTALTLLVVLACFLQLHLADSLPAASSRNDVSILVVFCVTLFPTFPRTAETMDSPPPPWDDEDAMIAEDMELVEEAPPTYDQYDEAMLEEAEGGASRVDSVNAVPPSIACPTIGASMSDEEDNIKSARSSGRDDRQNTRPAISTTATLESDDNNSIDNSIREQYQRKRPSTFQFERYVDISGIAYSSFLTYTFVSSLLGTETTRLGEQMKPPHIQCKRRSGRPRRKTTCFASRQST